MTTGQLQAETRVLVTGATGFLGQSLVEKILWSVPDVRRIYVLIRAQPQLGGRVRLAQERLENTPCHPVGSYQATKLAGEQQLLEEATGSGLPVVIARPSFTYGPGDTHKLALFRAVKKKRFAFVGGGRGILHPLFIDDLVAGIQLCAVVGQAGQAYILGGERPVTVREQVNELDQVLILDLGANNRNHNFIKKPSVKTGGFLYVCIRWFISLG